MGKSWIKSEVEPPMFWMKSLKNIDDEEILMLRLRLRAMCAGSSVSVF